jgi:hypothetical protein
MEFEGEVQRRDVSPPDSVGHSSGTVSPVEGVPSPLGSRSGGALPVPVPIGNSLGNTPALPSSWPVGRGRNGPESTYGMSTSAPTPSTMPAEYRPSRGERVGDSRGSRSYTFSVSPPGGRQPGRSYMGLDDQHNPFATHLRAAATSRTSSGYSPSLNPRSAPAQPTHMMLSPPLAQDTARQQTSQVSRNSQSAAVTNPVSAPGNIPTQVVVASRDEKPPPRRTRSFSSDGILGSQSNGRIEFSRVEDSRVRSSTHGVGRPETAGLQIFGSFNKSPAVNRPPSPRATRMDGIAMSGDTPVKKLSKEEQEIACFENFPLGETTANYRRHTKDKSLDPARDRVLFKRLLKSKPDDSKYWNRPLVVNEDFHTMQQELWKEIREERAARGAEAAVSSAAERKEDSELETKV